MSMAGFCWRSKFSNLLPCLRRFLNFSCFRVSWTWSKKIVNSTLCMVSNNFKCKNAKQLYNFDLRMYLLASSNLRVLVISILFRRSSICIPFVNLLKINLGKIPEFLHFVKNSISTDSLMILFLVFLKCFRSFGRSAKIRSLFHFVK